MVFKDAVILSFYYDQDDPEEVRTFEALKAQLDARLRATRMGRYDGSSFDSKGQCFKIDLLGHDAVAMLAAIRPLVKEADFLIGPKATLIMRSLEQGSRAQIQHVDL